MICAMISFGVSVLMTYSAALLMTVFVMCRMMPLPWLYLPLAVLIGYVGIYVYLKMIDAQRPSWSDMICVVETVKCVYRMSISVVPAFVTILVVHCNVDRLWLCWLISALSVYVVLFICMFLIRRNRNAIDVDPVAVDVKIQIHIHVLHPDNQLALGVRTVAVEDV